MENEELVKALRCGGHNMIFHYCDKEDCPYCQYSYHDNLHRCNVQELGIDAVDALEAAEKKIAELEKELEIWSARSFEGKIGSMALINLNLKMKIYELEKRIPKEGEWIDLFEHDYKCSVCGEWYRMDGTPEQEDMNYCPNCGAKMKKNE